MIKRKGFIEICIIVLAATVITFTIFAVIHHVYKMHNDEDYQLRFSSITHGKYRYKIQNNNLLIIEKERRGPAYWNPATKTMMPGVITYKVIKVVPFTIDE